MANIGPSTPMGLERGKPSHLQAGCGKRGWIGLDVGVDITTDNYDKKKLTITCNWFATPLGM